MMELHELKAIVEAIIFVSDEPITERQLLEVLADASVSSEELSQVIETIREDSNGNVSRGLQLCEIAGGYQFRTKESCATWIQKLSVPKPVKLSQPSLESLAIIAYRQPIVRSEIEQIRGVDVGATLKTLLERNLIRIIGRRDEPGQPLIYGTSKEFLETFNLKNLHDLPTLADIEELARRQVETQTPAQLSIVHAQDEEEPTEIGDNEDEEEEEEEEEEMDVIPKEEEEDEEALVRLEKGLKELRLLERDIFPKQAETQEGQNAPAEQAAPSSDEGKPAESLPPTTDAIAEDDRTDN